ncbi:helix-turn-helix domain-containing protein [Hymenobacter siberiensis]|uniref:helix-turn-helix domain-containing protein n=1 Tax=Hymenobacter siberiensis TaxID=2848396 RepID=UPI001C1E653C|nr:helix-turn-helix domain-containing protein [Hymenobacter siberiensis]MBU6119493.1 helix-turn-helix domain-containing protein [Hymenobacter siberiensis]
MQVIIPVGVTYAQMLDDFRALIRHERSAAPVATAAGTPPADELLSIREAAEMLGVTIQTVHEWKRRGLLKYHKLGSRTYIKKTDVLAALQGHQRSEKPGKGATARKGSQRPAVA